MYSQIVHPTTDTNAGEIPISLNYRHVEFDAESLSFKELWVLSVCFLRHERVSRGLCAHLQEQQRVTNSW